MPTLKKSTRSKGQKASSLASIRSDDRESRSRSPQKDMSSSGSQRLLTNTLAQLRIPSSITSVGQRAACSEGSTVKRPAVDLDLGEDRFPSDEETSPPPSKFTKIMPDFEDMSAPMTREQGNTIISLLANINETNMRMEEILDRTFLRQQKLKQSIAEIQICGMASANHPVPPLQTTSATVNCPINFNLAANSFAIPSDSD